MDKFENLFTARQSLALTTLVRLVQEVGEKLAIEQDQGLAIAIQVCLGIVVDRCADKCASLVVWDISRDNVSHLFSRQTIPIIWDFADAHIIDVGLNGSLDWVNRILKENHKSLTNHGQAEKISAFNHSLPNDFIQAFISDPPYYDSIPYSDLSDFFYVWLKRSLGKKHFDFFTEKLTPKEEECIVDEIKGKNKAYFEKTMGQAMAEGCRILSPEGIAVIVFAHKSTTGWEAMLKAMIEAGWTITGSWAIDTEMGNRLRAQNSAALASSIHLVCRPRTKLGRI